MAHIPDQFRFILIPIVILILILLKEKMVINLCATIEYFVLREMMVIGDAVADDTKHCMICITKMFTGQ